MSATGHHASRYSLAVVSVLIAGVIRFAINDWVGSQVPFLTFFFAVMMSAWVGGIGPGLLAALLSALTANYLFIAPVHQLHFGLTELIPFGIFGMEAIAITVFSHQWKQREAAFQTAAAQVVKSEQQMRGMLEQASIGIALIDRTGKFLNVNDRMCAIAGRAREDLMNLSCRSITHSEDWPRHASLLQKVVGEGALGGSLPEKEMRYGRPDGTWIWVEVSLSPIRNQDGSIEQLVAIVADITDRKQAEGALRESEARFAGFMEHLPGLAWIKDQTGRYVFANDEALHAFEKTREWVYGKRDEDLFPPETAEQFTRNDHAVLASGSPMEIIETLEQADGRHYSLVNKFPIPASGENGLLIGGIAIDVTQRKRAEEALQDSEARLRLALEGARIGMWSIDLLSGINDCTPLNKELFGLKPDAPVPTTKEWLSLVHVDDRDTLLAAWSHSVARLSPYDVEYRTVWPDGSLRWMHSRGNFFSDGSGTPVRAIGITMDITERKQAEEALLASEERFRRIFNQAIAGIAETDLTGRFIQVNQRYADMVGRTADQLLRLRMQDITHPDDLPHNLTLFVPMVEDRGDAFIVEKRYVRPDGSVVWVSNNVSLLRDPDGKPRGVVAVSLDITARKQSEQALKRSEERYRNLYESMDEGFCVIEVLFDPQNNPVDYRFVEVNPAFERQTGILQARGRRMREIAPEHEQHWFDLYGHIVLTGEPKRFEYPAVQLHRWYEGYAYPLGEAWERKVAIIFNDITERKQGEEASRRLTLELEARVAERTSALVQSHEQLRALATELNLAEHRERKRLATELHDHLAQLLVLARLQLGQARKMPGLTSQGAELFSEMEKVLSESLTYTRTLVADLSPPILYEFGLEAALKWLIERLHAHHLRVTLLVDEPHKLELPEDQAVLLFQSVRELLMNVVKHGQVEQAIIKLQHDGACLRVQVEDHGVGFETSRVSTDSGNVWSSKFGLFSIRERMTALGGTFDIASVPGMGTTATLTLPLESRRSREHRELTSNHRFGPVSHVTAPSKTAKNSEPARIRVLLVDDHAMVRQGLRSVLDSYADIEVVGEASNGEEAVQHMERLRPSVVVMDINMPTMNGIEATATIKTRYPQTIVIGLSVNSAGENQDAMKTAGASLLLTKEAAVEQLHGAIRGTVKTVRIDATQPRAHRARD